MNKVEFYNSKGEELRLAVMPIMSDWELKPLGVRGAVTVHLQVGSVPNCFHRKMQELCFGVKYFRIKK